MRNFIFGTDWWTDCDDAVAIRLLSYFVRKNEVKVLGFCVNARMEYSARSFDVFRKDCGFGNEPVSIDFDAVDFGRNPPYQKRLAEVEGCYLSENDFGKPVSMYRRLLAEAEEPLEIIEIGYTQVLAALLMSEPDDFSHLNGVELVKRKVKKLWIMAGKWDEDPGKENNFARNLRTSCGAEILCRLWPTEITFLGWEVGVGVLTGQTAPENSLLRSVLIDHGSENGRDSWDPMLVLLACTGDESEAGYSIRRGRVSVDGNTGENRFVSDLKGNAKIVVREHSAEYYSDKINSLISDTYK